MTCSSAFGPRIITVVVGIAGSSASGRQLDSDGERGFGVRLGGCSLHLLIAVLERH